MTDVLFDLTRDSVEAALVAAGRTENEADLYHLVGMRNPSRSHYLWSKGRRHSLKAIAVLALRGIGASVSSRDYNTKDYAKRFRNLGFEVFRSDNETWKERERHWIEALRRDGQWKFRLDLFDIYSRCPLSGCETRFALEAAHVDTVRDSGPDMPSNGILLRADIHKLFDAHLLAINPEDGRVHLSSICQKDYSGKLAEKFIPPKGGPSLQSFINRWNVFKKSNPSKHVESL